MQFASEYRDVVFGDAGGVSGLLSVLPLVALNF